MYSRIPEGTRYRDELSEEGGKIAPLRQLISVLASGLESIKGDIDGITNLLEVDNCPDKFLPHLAGLFGFEFPYDLPADKQRNFLRSLIPLAMAKGTPWSIRLAALRVIGDGFDLTIKDEDYRAKTFTVEVIAEGSGQTNQLEQKLSYMVHQYTPAGMVPSIVVIYYFAEETELSDRVGDDHSSWITTAWRTNFSGHTLSGTMKASDFGTTPLTI